MKLSELKKLISAHLTVSGDKDIQKIRISTVHTEFNLYEPKSIGIVHDGEQIKIIFNG